MTAATPITPRTLALTDRGFDDHGDAVIVLPTEAIQIPPLLARCYLGLGWSERPGLERLDLDASALCHDASGALVDVVSFEQLRNRSAVMDASIVHSGDTISTFTAIADAASSSHLTSCGHRRSNLAIIASTW